MFYKVNAQKTDVLNNLVDPFSGQFTYNIPVLILSSTSGQQYPLTVQYSTSIHVDLASNMVGLGFNINPGEITRQVIGMPDDFNDNYITRNTYYQQYPPDCGSGTDCAKGYLYDVSTGTATPSADKIKTSYYYGPIYYSNFPTRRRLYAYVVTSK